MAHSFEQLSPDGNRWTLSARREDGALVKINAAHVISSAPMRELADRIEPKPQTIVEANRLNYRDFLTVALMIRSKDLFPDNWIYIHDSKVLVGRVQNFRSWSPEMVPDPTIACVGLEYFCFEGDTLWASSDADLIELAKKEMGILGCASPRMSSVARWCGRKRPIRSMTTAMPTMSPQCVTNLKRNIRPCTLSAATVCTAITTRITR
jgi:protoporphyrinogen oxidase